MTEQDAAPNAVTPPALRLFRYPAPRSARPSAAFAAVGSVAGSVAVRSGFVVEVSLSVDAVVAPGLLDAARCQCPVSRSQSVEPGGVGSTIVLASGANPRIPKCVGRAALPGIGAPMRARRWTSTRCVAAA